MICKCGRKQAGIAHKTGLCVECRRKADRHNPAWAFVIAVLNLGWKGRGNKTKLPKPRPERSPDAVPVADPFDPNQGASP